MTTLPAEAWNVLIEISEEKNVFIEGNLLKLLDPAESKEAAAYMEAAIEKDSKKRETRLEVTKKAQEETRKLQKANEENSSLMQELQDALERAKAAKDAAEKAREESDVHRRDAEDARIKAEQARATAENDLDYMQKQTQFELMNQIVRSAIYVVIGVGIVTTSLYVFLVLYDSEQAQITMMGNAWTNMFGILLTNSFSIIGTVMGVKYATEKSGSSES